MGKSCGAKCAKYFLFILNTLFFLAGGVILAVGLWLRFDKTIDRYFRYNPSSTVADALGLAVALQTAWAIFIAFGAFVFVVGFCGCCGAIRESKCLLSLYTALIVVTIAGELGGGIYAYVKFKDFSAAVDTAITNDTRNNYPNNSSLISDLLMTELSCCGWTGYADFNLTVQQLPRPCCSNSTAYASCNAAAKSSNVTAGTIFPGCKPRVIDSLQYAGVVFIGVGVGIAVLELIVLIAAIGLCCSID